jgi:hypothetical protein
MWLTSQSPLPLKWYEPSQGSVLSSVSTFVSIPSLIDREIRKVFTDYDATEKFVWSATAAFEDLKTGIKNRAYDR